MKALTVSPLQKELVFQIVSQLLYIALTLWFAAQTRSFGFWASLLAFNAALSWALGTGLRGKRDYIFNFSTLAITNNIILNMEAFSPYGIFIAGAFAFFSKRFLCDQGGVHVFNPGAFGVVAVSVLFPQFGSSGSLAWGAFSEPTILVLGMGLLVTVLSKTFMISISYAAGFAVVSTVSTVILQNLSLLPAWETDSVPPQLWPLSLASTGSMIFIFHVVSDPRTSPRSRNGKILFGLSIASLDFALRRNAVVMPDFLAYLIVQGIRGAYNSVTGAEAK